MVNNMLLHCMISHIEYLLENFEFRYEPATNLLNRGDYFEVLKINRPKYRITIKFMIYEDYVSFVFEIKKPSKIFRKRLRKKDAQLLYQKWMYVRDIASSGCMSENDPLLIEEILNGEEGGRKCCTSIR